MSIEKGLAQSRDSFQMMYLRDYECATAEILIIESNTTLAMELQKILMGIGFKKIYLSRTGAEGIKIFSDLTDMGKIIPVIINDQISDKTIDEIVNEILDIHPGASVIVESSSDPTDQQIKKLFDIGVVSHIYKPLRSDNIRKAITSITKEEKTSVSVTTSSIDEELENLLRPYKKISKKKILESLDFKALEIEQGLEKLEFAQKIIPLDEIKQAVCNTCNSGNIVQISTCPECSGVSIFHRPLLECLDCKHTFEQKFEGMDKCPECKKDLVRKGVDYARLDNNYYCTECANSRSDLKLMLECWNCQNRFEHKDAKWENSMSYKIRK